MPDDTERASGRTYAQQIGLPCFMPKTERTIGLKNDVAGIEGYLSLDFYDAAEKDIGLIVIRPGDAEAAGWKLGVDKAEMAPASRICTSFCVSEMIPPTSFR
jgi:hypothetical protein